jgi:hypothetical protein
MGWSFPWASSHGSDFNYDFQAAHTEEQQRSGVVEYNFRAQDGRQSLEAGKEGPLAEWAAVSGTDWATYTREAPGMSAFALEDGVVYHTYSAYARGDGRPLGACTSGSTGRLSLVPRVAARSHSSFPRNEVVPGSSQGVGFFVACALTRGDLVTGQMETGPLGERGPELLAIVKGSTRSCRDAPAGE